MGTFMISKALKLVNSMQLKQTLTGNHRRAVLKLKGSYFAAPSRRPTSTRTVAIMHWME